MSNEKRIRDYDYNKLNLENFFEKKPKTKTKQLDVYIEFALIFVATGLLFTGLIKLNFLVMLLSLPTMLIFYLYNKYISSLAGDES